MPSSPTGEVTELLLAWREGDRESFDRLLPMVYEELHGIAERHLHREHRLDHTLQPTALIHETYLRLVDQRGLRWQDRAHFFAIAATTMRRILVEHARRRATAKRNQGEPAITLAEEIAGVPSPELVALDDCLTSLAEIDPAKASIVELRYFGGLSIQETAEVVGCSPATVVRHWRLAKAWLYNELRGDPP